MWGRMAMVVGMVLLVGGKEIDNREGQCLVCNSNILSQQGHDHSSFATMYTQITAWLIIGWCKDTPNCGVRVVWLVVASCYDRT